MVTKRDLEVAIAAYGLGRVLPAGSTRAAARAAVGTIVKAGRVVVPPVARATTRTALANPLLAAGILGTSAYQAGLLDPAIARAQEEARAAQMFAAEQVMEAQRIGTNPIYGTLEDFARAEVPKRAKRKVSKHSKAVKAGIAAVKKSKLGGTPGTITNAKSTFATVSKIASAVNKGKKVAKTGIKGVASRAIKGILRR